MDVRPCQAEPVYCSQRQWGLNASQLNTAFESDFEQAVDLAVDFSPHSPAGSAACRGLRGCQGRLLLLTFLGATACVKVVVGYLLNIHANKIGVLLMNVDPLFAACNRLRCGGKESRSGEKNEDRNLKMAKCHVQENRDAQRKANQRCAALSRSVQRPKGARLSAMLDIFQVRHQCIDS
jgi:hypothetical protein